VKTPVLILAQDRHWSSSLTAAIEAHGYQLLVAPTAALALGALRHIRFDVLVGPFWNATISGTELGTQARLIQPKLRLVAVIEETDHNTFGHANFDAVLREPVLPAKFHQTISALLRATPETRPGRFLHPRYWFKDGGSDSVGG
jgi:DNA-binding NtrC family response regulator